MIQSVISFVAASSVALAIIAAVAPPAVADVAVKSKSKCLHYGGKVQSNTGSLAKSYPWICSIPAQDRKCAKKFGKLAYFNPDVGQCRNISDDVGDADDEWMDYFDY